MYGKSGGDSVSLEKTHIVRGATYWVLGEAAVDCIVPLWEVWFLIEDVLIWRGIGAIKLEQQHAADQEMFFAERDGGSCKTQLNLGLSTKLKAAREESQPPQQQNHNPSTEGQGEVCV